MKILVYQYFYVLFFKQKTAYEMRISDWSSDVCSSDLTGGEFRFRLPCPIGCNRSAGGGHLGSAQGVDPYHDRDLADGLSDRGSGCVIPRRVCAQEPQIGRASFRERVCKYL